MILPLTIHLIHRNFQNICHLPLMIKILLSITLILTLISSKTIELPTQYATEIFQMKLGQIYEIDQPKFPLEQVRSRDVKQIEQNSHQNFEPCDIVPPQISFEAQDVFYFNASSPKPLLVYKFEDIQYSQFLLDTHASESHVFMFFHEGTVLVTKISKDLKINSVAGLKASSMEEGQKLQEGYFVEIGEKVFFCSEKYIFQITDKAVTSLNSYDGVEEFESAIPINDKYIGILYEKGIKIYAVQKNSVQIIGNYEDPGNLYSDALFYGQHNNLFIIDRKKGLLSIDIDFSGQNPKIGQNKQILYEQQFCKLMTMNTITKKLHLECKFMIEFDLQKWPKVIKSKTNTHPDVSIRQMHSFGALTVYVGKDAFQIDYWNTKTEYYDKKSIDRLIFQPTYFIITNQDSMIIGNYSILNSYLRCRAQNSEQLGYHQVKFETVAKCNAEYFEQNNIDRSKFEFSEGDACLYPVIQTIQIWTPGKVMKQEIKITFIVLIAVVVIFLLFVVIKLITLRKVREEYATLVEKTGVHKGQESAKQICEDEQMEEKAGRLRSDQHLKDDKPEQQQKK